MQLTTSLFCNRLPVWLPTLLRSSGRASGFKEGLWGGSAGRIERRVLEGGKIREDRKPHRRSLQAIAKMRQPGGVTDDANNRGILGIGLVSGHFPEKLRRPFRSGVVLPQCFNRSAVDCGKTDVQVRQDHLEVEREAHLLNGILGTQNFDE